MAGEQQAGAAAGNAAPEQDGKAVAAGAGNAAAKGEGAGAAGDGASGAAAGDAGAAKDGAAKAGEGGEKKADDKASGDKKDSDAKKESEKPGVPEKYDLKLPDGSLLDPGRLEKIAADAKAQGLSNEQAQELVQREHQAVADFVKDNSRDGAKWNQQMDAWEKEALDSKDLGNGSKQKLAEISEVAMRGAKAYFPAEVIKYLEDTGQGSNPHVLRGLYKLGQLVAEGEIPNGGNNNPAGEKSTAEMFYGKSE